MVRRILLIATMLMFNRSLVHAASVTIADNNSSLKFTIDDPYILSVPNDPVQLPRTLEWIVDGRRILVYPSGPSNSLDIAHLHSGQHVTANQIHAQGPLLTFGTGAITGSVTGGIVYTVDGGTPDSVTSRVSEKVRIHNKTTGAVSISLSGLGFKPTQASLEVPDLTGLNITGTTVVFFQGNSDTHQLTDGPPFAPMTVLPVVSFSGFNPLFNQSFTLPAGAFLTMITELKVSPTLIRITTPTLWVLGLVAVIGAAIGMLAWRRRV